MTDSLERRAMQEYILAGGYESEWPFIDQITRNEFMKLAADTRRWERKIQGGNYDTLAEKEMDRD